MMRKVILVVSALLILASVASAAPITTLKNTGSNSIGAVDSDWTVDGGTAFVTSGWPLGAWKPNDTTSSWISAQPTYDGYLSDLEKDFAFSTSFEIPVGYDPTTARFLVRLMADNHLREVTLNGTPLGITYYADELSHSAFNTWSGYFLVDSGFLAGTNLLSFRVNNHPQDEPGNPAGLRVEFADSDMAEVAPVPEPGSMLLLGTGLLGAVRAFRKRR